MIHPRPSLLPLLATLMFIPASLGQASYSESFDGIGDVGNGQHGPAGLIAKGWTFRNQSSPLGPGDWVAWFWPYEGTGAMHIDSSVTTPGGTASSWAIPRSAGSVIARARCEPTSPSSPSESSTRTGAGCVGSSRPSTPRSIASRP